MSVIVRPRQRRRICVFPLRPYELDELLNVRDLDGFKQIIQQKQQTSTNEVLIKWVNSTILRTLLLDETNEKLIFLKYLIELPCFKIDYLDTNGRNCLMRLPFSHFNESFMMILISKGADMLLTDRYGNTILHIAAMNPFTANSAQAAKFFIEKGLDVNAENNEGKTPLYISCERGHTEWSYLFLQYNANPNIACLKNILPMTVIPDSSAQNQYEELRNLLFDYVFDSTNLSISLQSIAKSMALSTPFFQKICNHVSYINYEMSDFEDFCANLKHARATNVKFFAHKFGSIVEELVDYHPPLKLILEFGRSFVMSELKGILDVFVYSDHIANFVQKHDTLYPTISCLIKIFNSDVVMFVEEKEITRIACLLLEYGLCVTITDLDTAYKYYGYGELFKILLHMDIGIDSLVQVEATYEDERTRIQPSGMIQLLLNPTVEINDCLDDPSSFLQMLYFFNNKKLKEVCLKELNSAEVLEIVKNLPEVPCLVELSRNAARKYIVERYKIKICSQFYTILNWLPIGEKNRRILALEDKLY